MSDLDELANAAHQAPARRYRRPVRPQGHTGPILALLAAAFIVMCGIGLIVGHEHSIRQQPEAAPPVEEEDAQLISSADLYAAFHTNEIAAAEDYRGRLLEVSGIVQSVNLDFLDRPYIVLNGGPLMGVQCHFKRIDPAMRNLRRGDRVIVVGRCGTMIIGSVMVEDCSLGGPLKNLFLPPPRP